MFDQLYIIEANYLWKLFVILNLIPKSSIHDMAFFEKQKP